MKKALIAIVFAAATLPLTFAQSTPSKPATDQTSTAAPAKAKKTKPAKHSTKKTSATKAGDSTTPQK